MRNGFLGGAAVLAVCLPTLQAAAPPPHTAASSLVRAAATFPSTGPAEAPSSGPAAISGDNAPRPAVLPPRLAPIAAQNDGGNQPTNQNANQNANADGKQNANQAVKQPSCPSCGNAGCGPSACVPPPCCPERCCCADRFWINADYLLWWIQDTRLPPLLTTGSIADRIPGAVGQPRTIILAPTEADHGDQSGLRVSAGFWLNSEHTVGIEAGTFFLERNTTSFGAASNAAGNPLLAVPFLNAVNNQEQAALLSIPGLETGSATFKVASRLWGYDLTVRSQLAGGPGGCLSFLAGYRYLELNEQLVGTTQSAFLPGPIFGGASVGTSDSFADRNYFYGGQVGADLTFCRGRLSIDVLGKVALGDTHEVAVIDGSTTVQAFPRTPVTIPSGGFALPSISGRTSRDEFAVLPEAGINLGFDVTRHLRATVGYSFLYLSNAYRPGDLIDRSLNLTQIPPPVGPGMLVGPNRPTLPGRDSDFWAQGVSFGLQFRY